MGHTEIERNLYQMGTPQIIAYGNCPNFSNHSQLSSSVFYLFRPSFCADITI